MYSVRASSKNPMLLVVLLDSSISMGDPIVQNSENDNDPITKFSAASVILNDFLYEAVQKCVSEDNYKEYLDFVILSYGDKVFSPIKNIDVSEYPISVNKLDDDKTYYKIIDVDDLEFSDIHSPIEWINPNSVYGMTSMYSALTKAKEIISRWVNQHPDSHPPILLNITDGMATDIAIIDDEPRYELLIDVCDEIKKLKTNDGETLIGNAHLTDKEIKTVVMPNSISMVHSLRDEYAPLMYQMSSRIPLSWVERANKFKLDVKNESRLYIYNSNLTTLLKFFKFGTDPTNA